MFEFESDNGATEYVNPRYVTRVSTFIGKITGETITAVYVDSGVTGVVYHTFVPAAVIARRIKAAAA